MATVAKEPKFISTSRPRCTPVPFSRIGPGQISNRLKVPHPRTFLLHKNYIFSLHKGVQYLVRFLQAGDDEKFPGFWNEFRETLVSFE